MISKNPDNLNISYIKVQKESGFQIDLDMKKILSDAHEGDYLIMLEYCSPVKSGIRIIRRIEKTVIRAIDGFSFCNNSRMLKISIDERQTLQLNVVDNNSRNPHSIFHKWKNVLHRKRSSFSKY